MSWNYHILSGSAVSEDKAVKLPQWLKIYWWEWWDSWGGSEQSTGSAGLTHWSAHRIVEYPKLEGIHKVHQIPHLTWHRTAPVPTPGPWGCCPNAPWTLAGSCCDFPRNSVLVPTYPLGEEPVPNIQPNPHCFLWVFESQSAGVYSAKPRDLTDQTWVHRDLGDLGNAGPARLSFPQHNHFVSLPFALHTWVLSVYLTAACFHFRDILLTGFMLNNQSYCIF